MAREPQRAARARRGSLVPALALGGGLALALVVIALRLFVVEAFRIPSLGMYPTLRLGDHILANKLAFRSGPPRRGDVALFRREGAVYIQRVVGLPGDTVELRGADLLLNGVAVAHHPSSASCAYQDISDEGVALPHQCRAVEETLDGRKHVVAFNVDEPSTRQDSGPHRVPPEHLFLLGDNRDNSHDSRYYGPVPAEALVGRLWTVYWRRER